MAPTQSAKTMSSVQAIIDVKITGVKAHDLTPYEKDTNVCGVCLSSLFTKLKSTKTSKYRPAARLAPCGHLFHRHCIVEHIVCEKTARYDIDIDQIMGEEVEDGNDTKSDEGEEQNDVDLDSSSDNGAEILFDAKAMGVVCKCPLCGQTILPAERHYDYGSSMSRLERKFVRKYFQSVEGASERLARSNVGEGEGFATDLRAGEGYARLKGAEEIAARKAAKAAKVG